MNAQINGSQLASGEGVFSPPPHTCLIFNEISDRMASLAHFIEQGFAEQQITFCLFSKKSTHQIKPSLIEKLSEEIGKAKKDRVLFFEWEDIGFTDTPPKPEQFSAFIQEQKKAIDIHNSSGIRLTMDMTGWAGNERTCKDLLALELTLDRLVKNSISASLCQYSSNETPAAVLLEILSAHPMVLHDGIHCGNLYYIPEGKGENQNSPRQSPENLLKSILQCQKVTQSYRVNKEQYRATLDAMSSAIHVVDSDLKVLLVNRVFREWLHQIGVNTTIEGMNIFEAFPFLPEQVKKEYFLVFQNGKPLITEETNTLNNQHIITETRKIPIFERDKVARVLTIIEDITNRKKAEETLLRASRMEATATLAGGIAHDFNNLMVGVLGNAELLIDRCSDHPEEQRMLQSIVHAARRAGDLAQQMLTYAHRGIFQPKRLDLNSIINNALHFQQRSLPPQVEIIKKLDQVLWEIDADATQLSQVIVNLCLNASEAMPAGGTLTLSTSNRIIDKKTAIELDLKPGRYVVLQVQDSGCGMPPQVADRIFEPFFTTKFQGRGLGLAAVYGTVTWHQGQITVDSTPDRGTTVNVYLPAATEPTKEQPDQNNQTNAGTETILVVDDDRMVLAVTKKVLEKLGYRVLQAQNGRRAVELVKNSTEDIHLVLLDLGMPIMNGSEAMPLMKKLRPDIKILICSGYPLDESTTNLLRAGANGYVQKPFLANELTRLIRKTLDEA